jgi:hypothetical protein
MTTILAIDPGSFQSAWLRYDGTRPVGFGITANDILVRALRSGGLPDGVVIEKVESYGMALGAEVFDTVLWAGRFAEAAHRVPVVLLPRRAVKLALCGDSRAKDANIRQALTDRFGGSAAVGRKAVPARCTASAATSGPRSRSPSPTPSTRERRARMSDQVRRPVERDPLVAALARYVEALHRRYPDGPDQMRRERRDGRAKVSLMAISRKDPAA